MSDVEKIRRFLAQRPGLKAQQIATGLALDRTAVVAELHGALAAEVVQLGR